MKLVYIAGPYTAETNSGVMRNIQHAEEAGVYAINKGWFPVIPHKNTGGMERLAFSVKTDYTFWLRGCVQIMLKCDAVMLMDRYEESPGAQAEKRIAQAAGIPVYLQNELPQIKEA